MLPMKPLNMRPDSPATPTAARRLLMRWWGWLWLTTTIFGILIATRYYLVVDLDARPLALGFRTAMLIAHLGAWTGLLLAPVMILSRLAPRAAVILPLGVISSVLTLAILLVDTQVYLLYRFHINVGVLNLLLGGAALETFVFSRTTYAQAAAIALAISAVQSFAAWFWWRHVRIRREHRVFARSIAGAFAFSILGFHIPHVWADAVGFEPFVEQTDVLPARYAATAKRMLRKLGVPVRSEPLFADGPGDDNGLNYPLHSMACTAPAKQPNIVIIMIDSWRFDALTPRATPNIDAFARRSARFMDHYSGGNATRIGVFSLFYSIPGTYWHHMLAARQGPVFINELLRRDYEIGVFRSAPLFSPEFDRTVFAQVQPERTRSDGERPADWDRDLTNDFLAFLDSRTSPAPFFAFLFYDSPHKFDLPDNAPLPFKPSVEPNYLTLRNTSAQDAIYNRYLNSVHYVDSLIGEALTALKAHDLLEDSIVIITGDHGQEFNDEGRGYWGHNSNFTQYQTRVPFVIHVLGQSPLLERYRTTHFDVVPTLLGTYLGCTSPLAGYSVGRSLFEPGGREMLLMSEYIDFAIVQRDMIAVVRKHGMSLLSPKYDKLESAVLDPAIVKAALEQKSRFLESVGIKRP